MATDFEKSLDFYRRLGFSVVRSREDPGVRIAVLQVGSQELNLFSKPGVPSASGEQVAGMDHFCVLIQAESPDEVVAELKERGIDLVRGPIKRRDGIAFFVHDPDGVHVELQLKGPEYDSTGSPHPMKGTT
jgi:catechol 2,3-dioxygenase-like lactoylglutathione lyase family enzyme